jgi:cation:H+ antiporter
LFITITVVWTRVAGPADHSARDSEIEGIHPVTGDRRRAWALGIGYCVLGILGLMFGADLLVKGAVTIAESMGVSERIIGLTVVAMGTSLPELAASAVAAMHGEDEIALSNLMGSNIFNILAVLGVTASGFPVEVHARAAALDNWVMLGFAAALFPILWSAKRVGKWHGAVLLAGFSVYFAVLVVRG